jgi:hypothetical protein
LQFFQDGLEYSIFKKKQAKGRAGNRTRRNTGIPGKKKEKKNG